MTCGEAPGALGLQPSDLQPDQHERQVGKGSLSSTAGHDYVLMLAAHGPGKPYDLLNPVQAMYTVNQKGALTPVRTEGALPVGSLTQLRKLGD